MRTTTSAVAAFGAAALLLSGCGSDSLDDSKDSGSGGSSSSSSAAPAVKKDDALAKLVPADIAKMGTLTVGTDASYAPNEFTAADGKTIQGMDIDLLNEPLGEGSDGETTQKGLLVRGVHDFSSVRGCHGE